MYLICMSLRKTGEKKERGGGRKELVHELAKLTAYCYDVGQVGKAQLLKVFRRITNLRKGKTLVASLCSVF